MSKGVELNNPFDLMISPAFRWQGEIIATTGLVEGLCGFDTLADGLRAGFKDLLNAWKLDGLTTLSALVAHYAPPNENDTGDYLAGVCESTGWGRFDPLDLSDPERLEACGRAFLIEEQGEAYVNSLDPAEIASAATMALE
jgi:hypothetical protein